MTTGTTSIEAIIKTNAVEIREESSVVTREER
jgi:hypothetical protein